MRSTRFRPRVRLVAVLPALVAGLPLTGCSRQAYREHADREAYAILEETTAATPWRLPAGFNIESAPHSRLFDPGDPVDPVLPSPGPALYEYRLPGFLRETARTPEPGTPAAAADGARRTLGLPVQPVPRSYWQAIPRLCLARMLEFESVREEYRKLHGEDPPPDVLDRSRKLSLPEIVGLGLVDSREHQTEKERLYLAALSVTLERFDYSAKFLPVGNGVDADTTSSRSAGQTTRSSGIASFLGIDKMLATGGTLLASFANNVVLTYDGPDGWATDVASELFVSFNQSLFQRDILLEPLIQSERDLVYAARDFARFRRVFFVDLASRYYDLLRNYRSIEIESQNYFSLVRTYEQATAEARAGVKNAPNPVAVDQFEQSMLSGRSSLISTCNRLEQVLDNLKIAVGLPTETPINIDLSELDDLTLRDEVEVAAERVRRWLGLVSDRRGRPNPDLGDLLNGDIFLIERLLEWLRLRSKLEDETPDATGLRERLGRLRVSAMRVEVERNRLELRTADDPTAGAPIILLYARTSDLIEALVALAAAQAQLGEQLGRDREPIETVPERLKEARDELERQGERLGEILEDAQQRGLSELLTEAKRLLETLESLVDSLDEANGTAPGKGTDEENLRETLDETDRLLEITAELLESAGPGLPPLSISMDDAMTTALIQRFDMMNERGQLADTWRGIKLSADELGSLLSVSADYSLSTRDNKPVKFSAEDSQARVALAIDLPLNRRGKRNEFRRALIDYQAGRRRLMALEDSVKLDVRDGLRTLDETRIQYPISVTQAALAAEQVISVRLQLALGVQGVRGTDLLDAQEASRRALISVANARIGYLVDRALLALDLESLELDESGLRPRIDDRTYQLAPDLVYPEGAGPTYGDIPSFLWVSSDIRRLLDHAVPGEDAAATSEEAGPRAAGPRAAGSESPAPGPRPGPGSSSDAGSSSRTQPR